MVKLALRMFALYMCFNGTGIWGGETSYYQVLAAVMLGLSPDGEHVSNSGLTTLYKAIYTRRQINLYRMFFRRFLSQFSTYFDKILQGLFRVEATTVKFS